MDTIKIGVMGGAGEHGGQSYEQALCVAYHVGKYIAEHEVTLVTGATTGLPYAAVLGASDAGGEILGVSPAASAEDHVEIYQKPLEGYSRMHFTGRGLAGREVENVAHCTGIIVIGGGTGTMTEMGIASQAGIPIAGLLDVGGISDCIPRDEAMLSKYGSLISYHREPRDLVDAVVRDAGMYLTDPQGSAKKGHPFMFGCTREDLEKATISIDESLDDLIERGFEFGAEEREILKRVRR